ncbi:MAG: hypothetical protein ACXVBJ_11110, partial [Flavisolibacter sp.]
IVRYSFLNADLLNGYINIPLVMSSMFSSFGISSYEYRSWVLSPITTAKSHRARFTKTDYFL